MKKTIILINFALFVFLFFPFLVRGLEITNPLTDSDIGAIIKNIWRFLFMVALGVVPIMAIVAGFMFLSAGGNPEKIKKAKELLLWLAVGVAIILLAGGIVDLIKRILGVG